MVLSRVWTNGCFDLLHAGHVAFLQQAANLGELTVFVNDDASVRALKGGRRPITPLAERLRILQALRCVSGVYHFSGPTPVALWNKMDLVPSIYVKDSECDITHSEEGRWMLERGVAVTVLGRVQGISTTQIEQRIRNADDDAYAWDASRLP